ncbi:MAG TPA: DUF3306 domain-containing protein [Burkholderiaceae bacterium]|nr:DUF3306 domain-containing protein [Burkholderiaceae bacterium]HSB99736.1 DUF3306 domain-containing protein [Burkholderiaceae bacterium]
MDRDKPGFLSRWSRRKALARQAPPPAQPAASHPDDAANDATPVEVAKPAQQTTPVAAVTATHAGPASPADSAAGIATPSEPPPTLSDVAALTRDSDFRRFVAADVDREVKNAALKKLFADPHFNLMDGLDVYIDDYGKPSPLPASMARKLAQAAFLGLVEPERPQPASESAGPAARQTAGACPADANATAVSDPDENADLRLQSHDAAGCGSAEAGPATERQS